MSSTLSSVANGYYPEAMGIGQVCHERVEMSCRLSISAFCDLTGILAVWGELRSIDFQTLGQVGRVSVVQLPAVVSISRPIIGFPPAGHNFQQHETIPSEQILSLGPFSPNKKQRENKQGKITVSRERDTRH